MGTLSTADLAGSAGDRVRCCCGEWYDRAGDGGYAWRWPDGLELPTGYCKACARLRYRHDYPAVSAVAGAYGPAGAILDPQDPQTLRRDVSASGTTRRRRSDVS